MPNLLFFLKSKKWYFVVILIIALAILLRSWLLQVPSDYLTYTVNQGPMVDSIKVSSSYQIAMSKPIVSTANGIIDQSFVKNEDYIIEGEPLLHIQSTATDTQKATAYSAYMKAINALNTSNLAKLTAQSQLEKARQGILDARANVDDLEHHLTYGDDNSTTNRQYTQEEKNSKYSVLNSAKQNFSAFEKQYLDSDQSIAAAAANFQSTKLAYDATQAITLYAPATGVIKNYLKQIGDEVFADDQPILVISNTSNPTITIDVNEIYMPHIEVGQPATIIFDALKDQTFHGQVMDLETVGNDQNGAVSYKVKITINDINDQILPQMTAIVSVETFRKESVLSVPKNAVIYENNVTYLYKISSNGKKVEETEVKTGEINTDKIEIVSGIKSGDIVMINPHLYSK